MSSQRAERPQREQEAARVSRRAEAGSSQDSQEDQQSQQSSDCNVGAASATGTNSDQRDHDEFGFNHSSSWGNRDYREFDTNQNQRSSAQHQAETTSGDSDSSDNIHVQNYVGGGPDIEELEKPVGLSSQEDNGKILIIQNNLEKMRQNRIHFDENNYSEGNANNS